MGQLTTHVLDTSAGQPAEGIQVELYGLSGERHLIRQDRTNADGRLDSPLLDESNFKTGEYELVFHAGHYFSESIEDAKKFLDQVVIRFWVSDADSHYHVPVLLSPFGHPSRLENFRGIYLIFNENKNEIVEFIKSHINSAPEIETKPISETENEES